MNDVIFIVMKPTYKRWTQEEDREIDQLLETGATISDMAQALDRNWESVRGRLNKRGRRTQHGSVIIRQRGLVAQGLRRCAKCEKIQTLSVDNFYKGPSYHGGWACWCRGCMTSYRVSHREQRDYFLSGRLQEARSRAKRRNHTFTLTFPDLQERLEEQKGLCWYTGRPLTLAWGHRDSLSIDRADNKQGYTKENIVLCCSVINLMKQDMLVTEFLDWCRAADIYRNVCN